MYVPLTGGQLSNYFCELIYDLLRVSKIMKSDIGPYENVK